MALTIRKGQLFYCAGQIFCIGFMVGTVAACGEAGLADETPKPEEAPESHIPEDISTKVTNGLMVPAEVPTGEDQEPFDCGWFTTIWNGDAHYFLTNQSGEQTELFIDEEVRKKLGGLLSYDRKIVSISGVRVNAPREGLQIASINLEETCD